MTSAPDDAADGCIYLPPDQRDRAFGKPCGAPGVRTIIVEETTNIARQAFNGRRACARHAPAVVRRWGVRLGPIAIMLALVACDGNHVEVKGPAGVDVTVTTDKPPLGGGAREIAVTITTQSALVPVFIPIPVPYQPLAERP